VTLILIAVIAEQFRKKANFEPNDNHQS